MTMKVVVVMMMMKVNSKHKMITKVNNKYKIYIQDNIHDM